MDLNEEGSGSMSETASALVLECSTENLTLPQTSKIQKLQEDLEKLKLLLLNGIREAGKITSVPESSVGIPNIEAALAPALENCTNTNLVNFQVPQFFFLSPVVQDNQTTDNVIGPVVRANRTTDNVIINQTQLVGTLNQDISNTSTSQESSSQTTNEIITIKTITNRRTPLQTSTDKQRPVVKPLIVTANLGSGTSRTNRPSSPDIEVLKEMPPAAAPDRVLNSTFSSVTTEDSALAMLNIFCRPKSAVPIFIAMMQRKDLDQAIKAVLMKTPEEFVEWLLHEGLIRRAQFCMKNNVSPKEDPVRLKLGKFSDPKMLTTSGGYVWINDSSMSAVMERKGVSIFSGSIFGSTPPDIAHPSAIIKLIYHWAYQTPIANVESWVKVDRSYISKMYTYFRAVCSVMLQDKVYDLGYDGATVELGVISLGTSTVNGSKKTVKVEILGLYDQKLKSYRLIAAEPLKRGLWSRFRFGFIFQALPKVLSTSAQIICDQSIERRPLIDLKYTKLSVCETSDDEENMLSNSRIMSYLRLHIPKIFQGTLSQLTLEHVQLVLDELCWREKFGRSSVQAYNMMIEHLAYLTEREIQKPGLVSLLERVAQNPQGNWRYMTMLTTRSSVILDSKVVINKTSSGNSSPQVASKASSHVYRVSTEDYKKAALKTYSRNRPRILKTTKSTATTQKTQRPIMPKPSKDVYSKSYSNLATAMQTPIELEPYYYGQIDGDPTLGKEINTFLLSCHMCAASFDDNIEFYTHLKRHLSKWSEAERYCCNYCAYHFRSEEAKRAHQNTMHLQKDLKGVWCRICNDNFNSNTYLVSHMVRKHSESELPYRCEVCNFSTSLYVDVINHFREQHRGSPYIQCHYCLLVKTITSSSALSISQKMFQHMRKHANLQGQCKTCTLCFYSKLMFENHKKKDHVSRANVKGLRHFVIPEFQEPIMFRPSVRLTKETVSPYYSIKDTVAISSTLDRLNQLSISLNSGDSNDEEDKNYYCLECDANLTFENHFVAYQKCTKCSFASCCRNMVMKHMQVFHSSLKNFKFQMGPPIVLPKPLYCICGFSTRSGNHLARHLALCEAGHKSAYPTLSAAMSSSVNSMALSAGASSMNKLLLGNGIMQQE